MPHSRPQCAAITALLTLLVAAAPAAAQDTRTITITGTDDMQWDVTRIEAEPGERIRVVVRNVSRLGNVANPHNFVVVERDTDVDRFVTLSSVARRHEYIAPQMEDRVIVATGLVGGGESAEVTFTAPEEKGDYPYVCTFPGHYAAGMRGILAVE